MEIRQRSFAERYAYVLELDRSLGLDTGRTEAQERWRRIGPSARRVLRDAVLRPDPVPPITVEWPESHSCRDDLVPGTEGC